MYQVAFSDYADTTPDGNNAILPNNTILLIKMSMNSSLQLSSGWLAEIVMQINEKVLTWPNFRS